MDFAALQERIQSAAAPLPTMSYLEPVKGLSANIDGDYLAYYCSGNDDTNPGTARHNVIERLDRVKFATGAERVVIHLSTDDCTKGDRFHVATIKTYQGQRDSGRKPVNWQHLRNFMYEYDGPHFIPKLWQQREADDGMAYVSHSLATLKGQLHVVHTRDKDMRMFAGRHVDWMTYQITDVPLGAYEVIGPDEKIFGHKWFWMQMLMGDAADNIPGIHRLGEKKALGILAGTTHNAEAAGLVAGQYEGHFGDTWADAFVEMAALLWMRTDRHADLLDFLSLGCFGTRVLEAAARLAVRVDLSKQSLAGLAN